MRKERNAGISFKMRVELTRTLDEHESSPRHNHEQISKILRESHGHRTIYYSRGHWPNPK